MTPWVGELGAGSGKFPREILARGRDARDRDGRRTDSRTPMAVTSPRVRVRVRRVRVRDNPARSRAPATRRVNDAHTGGRKPCYRP